MTWATRIIAQLRAGETVTFRPHGHSMTGRVNDGDTVVVAPLDRDPEVNDVVLVTVGSRDYLHLVKAVDGARYLIGNNRGRINGWVSRDAIAGRMIRRSTEGDRG